MYVVVQFDQDVFLTGLVTFILAQHYEHLDNPKLHDSIIKSVMFILLCFSFLFGNKWGVFFNPKGTPIL